VRLASGAAHPLRTVARDHAAADGRRSSAEQRGSALDRRPNQAAASGRSSTSPALCGKGGSVVLTQGGQLVGSPAAYGKGGSMLVAMAGPDDVLACYLRRAIGSIISGALDAASRVPAPPTVGGEHLQRGAVSTRGRCSWTSPCTLGTWLR